MPDPVLLAGPRPKRLAWSSPLAIELVGGSASIARVQELLRRAAALDSGVLLLARRGSDAAGLARDLHARSPRASAPFVGVACGATGIEQALFGNPAGYAPPDLEMISTDSRIAAARGGTLFLEDVTELPAAVQARLARVARDGEARLDGDVTPLAIRVVVSAAPGIDADVCEHRFRADLYRRVSVSRIELPPLSERPEDIPALAERLLEEFCVDRTLPPRTFTQAALALLGAMTWPGNLAELREAVERAAASTDEEAIQIEHLLPTLQLNRAPASFEPAGTLREARLRFEHDYIAAVLQHHGWRMTEAAHTLGIQRPNLYRKARQLGIPLARNSE
ncbi:MAG: sigma-54-dependent Fis family transcriptional regulator [Acidobacteria bacterium]|nr:sigma-54-dependent Fis family transcriptional regulator [Acidobacteriota bacterium]